MEKHFKYKLWVETETDDGFRFRRDRYFETKDELNAYLDDIEKSEFEGLSDCEISVWNEETGTYEIEII